MQDTRDIAGPIMIVAAILVILCAVFSYGVTRRLLEVRENARIIAAMKSDPHHIEQYLQEHRHSLTLLAGEKSFAGLLAAGASGAELRMAVLRANEILAEQVAAAGHIRKLSLLDLDGNVVASSVTEDVGIKESTAGARGGTSDYAWANDMRMLSEDESLSFVVLLPVRVNGSMVGMIKGHIDTRRD